MSPWERSSTDGQGEIPKQPRFGEAVHVWDTWLRGDAVAVAWGLAGDEHAHGFGAAIEGLVTLAGRDFESFAGL